MSEFIIAISSYVPLDTEFWRNLKHNLELFPRMSTSAMLSYHSIVSRISYNVFFGLIHSQVLDIDLFQAIAV